MARKGVDLPILSGAIVAVVLLAGVAAAAIVCAVDQGQAGRALQGGDDGGAAVDEADPLPDFGTLCGRAAKIVKEQPAKGGGIVGDKVMAFLKQEAAEKGVPFSAVGWRGREDRERRDACRVSFRYELQDDRGAAVWLLDPNAPAQEHIEAQGRVSVAVTDRITYSDEALEKRLTKKCRDAVETVKRHFSFMERYGIWGCLRKTAGRAQARGGPEVEWGHWKGEVESAKTCLVSVDLIEDDEPRTEYYRIRFHEKGEHELTPLTKRAIESILGPGIYSR